MPGPTLAITGSNGKTILKDFLAHSLMSRELVYASPGSYNSQVGVALSLLARRTPVALAIIEAGVSQQNEMQHLAAMIRPRHGVLTNIGLAHFEGFGSRAAIAREKIQLFRDLPPEGWLLIPDDPLLDEALLADIRCPIYRFGSDPRLPKLIATSPAGRGRSQLHLAFPDGQETFLQVAIDYSWREVFQTLLAGICTAWLFGISANSITRYGGAFNPPLNRLELWQSEQGCLLANDSYSADPVSTRSCLSLFDHYQGKNTWFIFAGMGELGERGAYEHRVIGELAARKQVKHLLLTGPHADATAEGYRHAFAEGVVHQFDDTAALTRYADHHAKEAEVVLIKGPREARLDTLTNLFKSKLTQTVYYISLTKIRDNALAYRGLMPADGKLLVMLKAFAYGTDAGQIARFLQTHVDFFGVAYVKEAVSLRRQGINNEILVQLVLPDDVDEVARLDLQPVVFSLDVARALNTAAERHNTRIKIHLKVDTGMGRFGVFPDQVGPLAAAIQELKHLQIEGLMTHFSSADDPEADAFSREQLAGFEQARAALNALGIDPPLCHAAASAAAARFPEARFSMIRIGLGVYGIYPSREVAETLVLKCPVTLLSQIGSLKTYPPGYPISYNQRFTTKRESRIAFMPLGYYDGLSRKLSNQGYVIVNGRRAPIVGSVCMDFTAVDVTGIEDVAVGDPVLVFGEWRGNSIRVEELAEMEGTIPYEVLVRWSHRIQRIYLMDEE
nr:alanine racemase [Acanthopleuribacter pedis]